MFIFILATHPGDDFDKSRKNPNNRNAERTCSLTKKVRKNEMSHIWKQINGSWTTGTANLNHR
ncbi:Hypothetical protein BSM4216_1094 [Bacillus smithii]|jgi:hypothetical protein|nr:Hypothetical protein BSM4216_1094 [Bacillus smithii]